MDPTALPHATPHVVVVTAEYSADARVGGLATYTDMLMDYLRERYAHVHVVEIPYQNQKEFSVHPGAHGQFVRMPFPRFHVKQPDYDGWLEKAYQALPADVPLLIIGNESYGAWVGHRLREAAGGRARLVYVPHLYSAEWYLEGYTGERFTPLLKDAPLLVRSIVAKEMELLGGADFVLFISQYMRQYAEEWLNTVPERSAIIEHYVEPAAVVKQHYAEEIRDVIFFGRLEFQKGLQDIFEHLEDVLRLLPRATLHIYGKGSLEAVLKWRSRRHAERVVLHGFTPRQEVLRVLPRMDLALMPSIYESFGYSALEAMAAGVPLVASDTGGLGELTAWLPEGLRLRTVSEGSPLFRSPEGVGRSIPREEVLRVLSFAAAHPQVLAEAGRQGAALARERYTAAHYARAMDAFFARVRGQA